MAARDLVNLDAFAAKLVPPQMRGQRKLLGTSLRPVPRSEERDSAIIEGGDIPAGGSAVRLEDLALSPAQGVEERLIAALKSMPHEQQHGPRSPKQIRELLSRPNFLQRFEVDPRPVKDELETGRSGGHGQTIRRIKDREEGGLLALDRSWRAISKATFPQGIAPQIIRPFRLNFATSRT